MSKYISFSKKLLILLICLFTVAIAMFTLNYISTISHENIRNHYCEHFLPYTEAEKILELRNSELQGVMKENDILEVKIVPNYYYGCRNAGFAELILPSKYDNTDQSIKIYNSLNGFLLGIPIYEFRQ